MEPGDLKKLKKLVTFCRKHGISSIKVYDLEVHLGPAPEKAPRGTKSAAGVKVNSTTTLETIYPEEPQLTPEQVLFYSVPDAGLDGPQEVQ